MQRGQNYHKNILIKHHRNKFKGVFRMMNWIINYAQLKFYEEIIGLVIGGILLIIWFILWLILWFEDRK